MLHIKGHLCKQKWLCGNMFNGLRLRHPHMFHKRAGLGFMWWWIVIGCFHKNRHSYEQSWVNLDYVRCKLYRFKICNNFYVHGIFFENIIAFSLEFTSLHKNNNFSLWLLLNICNSLILFYIYLNLKLKTKVSLFSLKMDFILIIERSIP